MKFDKSKFNTASLEIPNPNLISSNNDSKFFSLPKYYETYTLVSTIKNEEKLNMLNSLIHPSVWEMVMDEVRIARQKEYQYLVIESAILVEAGYKKVCDEIWFVRSKKDIRIKRLSDTRGYSVEKSESIINNQAKEDVFIKNCDIIIDNDEDITKLECAIDGIINSRKE